MSIAEELNSELYEKMDKEQKAFYEQLLTLPPAEILEKAYEYSVREDIMLIVEEAEMSEKQCKVLLKSETPLADVFSKYRDGDSCGHMEEVRNALEGRANDLIREEFKKLRDDAR